MLQMFRPVTPVAPKASNRKPPTSSAHNSKRDVEPESLALSVDDLASDEPGNQAKYDPTNDGHVCAFLLIINRGVASCTPAANSTAALRSVNHGTNHSCVHCRPTDCARAGPCGCWRTRSWNSASSIAPATHDRADAQKNTLKPHRRQCWVIPPKANSAFVAAMEDVLAVYTRPRDPDRPLVCLDETSKQLIAETRVPIPMKPGRPARFDYEYARNGTANLFMMFAPLEGWRHVEVTDRHTAVDYAHVLKDLADIHFADAKTIVLVQDNLNIHCKASLYDAFPAAEARRLVERFEWHYTPKHGSWLNLAESELGVLSSQCLDRRIPDKHTLIEEIAAWQLDRNAQHTKANWHFTTPDARVKLKHLYPSI